MNRFRKYLAVVCTLVMMGASSSTFANFLVVTPEQISITPEGLFVSIDGFPIAVESLNIANGGFIVAVPIPSPNAEICPRCGHDTYTLGRTCSTCGFPIWDEKKPA